MSFIRIGAAALKEIIRDAYEEGFQDTADSYEEMLGEAEAYAESEHRRILKSCKDEQS